MTLSNAEVVPATPLDLAREYTARGLRPFPVRRGTKGATSAEHYGAWATKTASEPTDAMLRLWFPDSEPRNIAIGCKGSGLAVIDEDTDGEFARLCADQGHDVPTTFRVSTSPGRWQHWFRDPTGTVPNRADHHGYDLDVRGPGGENQGGYVIAPGSLHPGGGEYIAVDPGAEIIEMPEWLAGWARTARTAIAGAESPAGGLRNAAGGDGRGRVYTPAQARSWVDTYGIGPLREATAGTRNDRLNTAALVMGHFADAYGYGLDRVRARLLGLDVVAGLVADDGQQAVDATIASGFEAGCREPYTVVEEPSPVDGDGSGDDDGALSAAVSRALFDLRVRDVARREFARERGTEPAQPAPVSLTDLLAQVDDAPDWAIDSLWPAGGKVLLSGPAKAGKTTLIANVVKSFADGVPLLARPQMRLDDWRVASAGFAVPERRRVVLLDFEMTASQLRRWLREVGVVATDDVHIELMRGRAFDPRDPAQRATWAAMLRGLGAGVLIVDPIRPLLAALGLDENSAEVQQVLTALDTLCADGGVTELLVGHHTNHQGERASGSTAFLGWPDALWFLTRDPMSGQRAFSAEGRDVLERETVLTFDRGTRRLALGEGDRAANRDNGDVDTVSAIIAETQGETVRGLRQLARETELGTKEQRTNDAIKAAVACGRVHVHYGRNRAQHHYPGACATGCGGHLLGPVVPPR